MFAVVTGAFASSSSMTMGPMDVVSFTFIACSLFLRRGGGGGGPGDALRLFDHHRGERRGLGVLRLLHGDGGDLFHGFLALGPLPEHRVARVHVVAEIGEAVRDLAYEELRCG